MISTSSPLKNVSTITFVLHPVLLSPNTRSLLCNRTTPLPLLQVGQSFNRISGALSLRGTSSGGASGGGGGGFGPGSSSASAIVVSTSSPEVEAGAPPGPSSSPSAGLSLSHLGGPRGPPGTEAADNSRGSMITSPPPSKPGHLPPLAQNH